MRRSRSFRCRPSALLAGVATCLALGGGAGPAAEVPADVLIITVDTLRHDRLSSYGYARPTTPNIDRILRRGVRFTEARVVEPLTNPSLCSMLTSVHPHQHGATRNGLRIRPGLVSLPGLLRTRGYRTAAFVGNWTLRNKLSGLAEHFEHYEEVLTRRRWLGFLRREATAEDLTSEAVGWIEEHRATRGIQPFLVWVHYVEPHAPYVLHEEFVDDLGITSRGKVPPEDRYDTEIAFVDHWIGELLEALERVSPMEPTLIVFVADHGESLGEHGYWGHGRHLYEPGLRVPMGLYWAERLRPRVLSSPASNLDLAPTVLGLLGVRPPDAFQGFDWTPVLDGAPPPRERVTYHQAHRGAVISKHESERARRTGLLALARIHAGLKDVYRVDKGRRERFDLREDPRELRNLAGSATRPENELDSWMQSVVASLARIDRDLPQPLDEESVAALRSLGYLD